MGLQKYGRPNEATPAQWNKDYKDYNAPAEGAMTATTAAAQPVAETTSKEDVLSAPAIPPVDAPPASALPATGGAAADEVATNGDTKKRKRHEGETAEERAERKRKKKEKKEKA